MFGNRNFVIIRALFFFKALFWFALAAFYLSSQFSPNPNVTYMVVFLLLLVDAIGYLIFGVLVGRRSKVVFSFAVLFIIGNIALTLTDQVGTWDIVALALDSLTLAFIFSSCKRLA